ncbi:MAG: response regulator [SAR324 cluster bacterium]|nr:response regulator [SAR324 cluster bacterium]
MAKIVVVDDDFHLLRQISLMLEKTQHQSEYIAEPEYLFSLLEQSPRELIILDISMPGINGISLLNQLKVHPVFKAIPVIMLTADDNPNTQERCLREGAIDFVNKPINETVFLARIHAVLRRIQLEKQLIFSQKMQGLGTLSGGIAHDFNNILFAIMGNAELLQQFLTADSEESEHVDNILQACRRAKSVVSQLLSFTRFNEESLVSKQILPAVKEAVGIVRTSLPANIEIRENLNPGCPPILADSSQIRQMLVGICINAKAAMIENGGELTISMEPVTISSNAPSDPGNTPGNYLYLSIEDTGVGMSAEVKERIFDPFFTTKGLGGTNAGPSKEGTGLGLYVVFQIVERHNGVISVESSLGKGSKFHLYFPAFEEGTKEEKDLKMPSAARIEDHDVRKKLRILLAEDEPMLRNLYIEFLKDMGHQITQCGDGEEALQVFLKNPADFDLLFTDQEMPKLTGIQLSREILKIRPDLPIILATGFSDQVSRANCQQFGIRKCLMKPMNKSEFQEAVLEIAGQVKK